MIVMMKICILKCGMLKVADEDGTMTEIEVSLKKELTVSAASQ
jgi:hypothetical protein